VLDAGTGIRLADAAVPASAKRVDVLLTHLHMDHIIGLGFFPALQRRGLDVHIWGPKTAGDDLRTRLTRYLSPPLFPVRLRDLPSVVTLHEIASAETTIGEFHVTSSFITHPDPALGFRVSSDGRSLAYLPDHEPALGVAGFPLAPQWTSGHRLAAGADLLLHDSQYTEQEYGDRVGWGHSSVADSVAFAKQAEVGKLLLFHHDPSHDDATMDSLAKHAALHGGSGVATAAAVEGVTVEV
jgi:phosphoribosyl 1,2-cyclic phosphodiesterase